MKKMVQIDRAGLRYLLDEIVTITHAVPGALPDVHGYVYTKSGRVPVKIGDWIVLDEGGGKTIIKKEDFKGSGN